MARADGARDDEPRRRCSPTVGATWKDVVKTTVFLHDMNDFPDGERGLRSRARRRASGAFHGAGVRAAAQRARRDRRRRRHSVRSLATRWRTPLDEARAADRVRPVRRVRGEARRGGPDARAPRACRCGPIRASSSDARRSTTPASSCCPTISRSCRPSTSSRRSSTIRICSARSPRRTRCPTSTPWAASRSRR